MKRARSYSAFLERPPARKAPGHILNVLNDDCIKEILSRLQNRRDFINAAHVCKRFLYVAQVWFTHEALQIGDKYRKSSICPRTSTFIIDESFNSNKGFLKDLFTYLSVFVKRLRSIEWFQMSPSSAETTDKIFRAIEHFCGKTLIRLVIRGRVEVSLTSAFEVLERFELHYGVLDRFEPSHSLNYLRLTQLHRDLYSKISLWRCLEKNFPELVEAHLGDFSNLMPTTNWFKSFLKCNPQLRKLTLIANQLFVPHAKQMIHDNVKYLRNLESLHVDLFALDVSDLSQLTKLKFLRMPHGCLGKKEMDALVALDLPIEELEITLRTGNIYVAKCISKFKKIKTLTLHVRLVLGRPLSNVIENLPPLDHLIIRGVDISKTQDIRNYGKHIKRITN